MKLEKYRNLGNWILLAGLFVCCVYALHDVQTAEGIGLYFTLKLGWEQRLCLDVAVDVICMATLVGILYLPCRMFSYRTSASYLRLFIGYLAMIPQLSLTKIMDLFRVEEWTFLSGMNLGEAVAVWVYSLASFLRIWVPLFILLYGFASVNQSICRKQWYKRIATVIGLLLLLLLLFPSMENILLYLAGYMGLLIAFDCWEGLLQKMPQLKRWYWLVFGLLLLRGVYRLMVLVSLV